MLVTSFRTMHSGGVYPALSSQSQTTTGEQRARSNMPPRKARKANLSGIDEEPSRKAMRLLGMDEPEVQSSAIVKGKAKGGKRFYEGRFGGLGRSDGGSQK